MKNQRIKIIIILGVFFAISCILSNNTINTTGPLIEDINIIENDDTLRVEPKASGFWQTNFIHITNDNWTGGGVPGLHVGDGTWNDPHIIENYTIDAEGTGSGILIENSNEPFIIRNCTIFNSGTGAGNAGIRLEFVNNSRILGNNCSNNGASGSGSGINLAGNGPNIVKNNTISGNILNKNAYGIWLYYSTNNNTIFNNTMNNNTYYGLYISGGGLENIIDENELCFNDFYGMYIADENNTIKNNNASHNVYDGIHVEGGQGNTIDNNDVLDNGQHGIYLESADDSIVLKNIANNNTNHGIRVDSGDDNLIYANVMSNNGNSGIDVDPSVDYSIIIGNTLINNPYTDGGSPWNVHAMNKVDGICSSLSINEDRALWGTFTWEEVEMYVPWIGSDGSWSDPYVIEDLIIDAGGSGSGLFINYSKDVYFTIQNCTIYNSGSTLNLDAGISLLETHNGTIIDCNCSNNGEDGIYMNRGINNTIINNTINDNSANGIHFRVDCLDNKIINNTITGNGDYGMYLYNEAIRTSVLNNTVNGNQYGIYIENEGEYNTVMYNTINDNLEDGIYLTDACIGTLISENFISDTGAGNTQEKGIYLSNNCDGNNITLNVVKNHDQHGIELEINCNNNRIFNNTAINNAYSGISLGDGSDGNRIYYNNFSNNANSGISIDNCNYTRIEHNFMIENDENAISMNSGNGSYIYNNTAYNTISGGAQNNGISIGVNSNDNIITTNRFYNHSESGITLNDQCDNNTIINNIMNDNTEKGIYIYGNCDNNTIIGNVAKGNGNSGINIDDNSDNSTINDNIAINNGYAGITIMGPCVDNKIRNNNCSNNVQYGINLDTECVNTKVENNLVIENGNDGISIIIQCNYTYIYNNTIHNRIIGVGPQGRGIYLDTNCYYITIYQNRIYNHTSSGIEISQNSGNNTIIDNIINNNGVGPGDKGIWLFSDCDYNRILNNDIFDNYEYGIRIEASCDYTIISGNTILDTNAAWLQLIGISIEALCTNSDITNNYVNCNDTGINVKMDCTFTLIQYNTIFNNTLVAGIYIEENSHNCTVIDNIVNDNVRGIWLRNINDTIVNNNTCSNTGAGFSQKIGITLEQAGWNNVTGNICNNNINIGIKLDFLSRDNIIMGNVLNGNNITDAGTNNIEAMNKFDGICTRLSIDADGGPWGTFTWDEVELHVPWIGSTGSWSDPYIIKDLILNANGSGSGLIIKDSKLVYFVIRNCTVYNSGGSGSDAGIRLEYSNNGTIIDCNCSFNGNIGIYINGGLNNTLDSNTANNNTGSGIYLDSNAKRNVIIGNTANFNTNHGIYADNECDYSKIISNTLNDNTLNGITIEDEHWYFEVTSNIINNNGNNGIFLMFVGHSTISGNIITNNGKSGIWLEDTCFNNTILNNQINNNLMYGVSIANISAESTNNTLYQNYFNNPLGINAVDNCSNNSWYLAKTGNWWHNYSGVDANDDNIGDTPYNITGTAGSQDLFPIWDDGCDVDCPIDGDGDEEPPDRGANLLLLAFLIPMIGVVVALGLLYRNNPEKFKNFAKKMRETGIKDLTTKISAAKYKKPKPTATVPAKPKAEVKKPEVKEEAKPVVKEKPKPAPEAALKETPTSDKVMDETELHNKYKAETGKNAIWRGAETKAYTEWKQKNLDK